MRSRDCRDGPRAGHARLRRRRESTPGRLPPARRRRQAYARGRHRVPASGATGRPERVVEASGIPATSRSGEAPAVRSARVRVGSPSKSMINHVGPGHENIPGEMIIAVDAGMRPPDGRRSFTASMRANESLAPLEQGLREPHEQVSPTWSTRPASLSSKSEPYASGRSPARASMSSRVSLRHSEGSVRRAALHRPVQLGRATPSTAPRSSGPPRVAPYLRLLGLRRGQPFMSRSSASVT